MDCHVVITSSNAIQLKLPVFVNACRTSRPGEAEQLYCVWSVLGHPLCYRNVIRYPCTPFITCMRFAGDRDILSVDSIFGCISRPTNSEIKRETTTTLVTTTTTTTTTQMITKHETISKLEPKIKTICVCKQNNCQTRKMTRAYREHTERERERERECVCVRVCVRVCV